jgi:hypothetical protein
VWTGWSGAYAPTTVCCSTGRGERISSCGFATPPELAAFLNATVMSALNPAVVSVAVDWPVAPAVAFTPE